MTNHLFSELASLNIRVNTITPSVIDTPALDYWKNIPEAFEQFTENQAIARPGRPEEAAYAAPYLASDEAAFITGANIIVDNESR